VKIIKSVGLGKKAIRMSESVASLTMFVKSTTFSSSPGSSSRKTLQWPKTERIVSMTIFAGRWFRSPA